LTFGVFATTRWAIAIALEVFAIALKVFATTCWAIAIALGVFAITLGVFATTRWAIAIALEVFAIALKVFATTCWAIAIALGVFAITLGVFATTRWRAQVDCCQMGARRRHADWAAPQPLVLIVTLSRPRRRVDGCQLLCGRRDIAQRSARRGGRGHASMSRGRLGTWPTSMRGC
jgi:hypothetical protein